VQLKPQTDEPLLAEEQDDIAQRMFERAKQLSDLEADVCDVLMINWLRHAENSDHRAFIDTDDLCRMRGLKPKLAGNGRRGGYTPEQRLIHLNAAKTIFDSWIIAADFRAYGKRARPVHRVLESRPFVVTDRIGDHRFSWRDSLCHDNCVDVLSFKYVVGEVFGAYLLANRQTALLSQCALSYSAKTHSWEKRLTRYLSHLWRCRARTGEFSSPIRVSTIFSEGLRLQVNRRRSAETQKRLAKAVRTLQVDGVISEWRYGRQEGEWPEWTIIVEPPAEIRRQYAHLVRVRVKNAGPHAEPDLGGQIRLKRQYQGLSQVVLAKKIGISQSLLSQVECGRAEAPQALRDWLVA